MSPAMRSATKVSSDDRVWTRSNRMLNRSICARLDWSGECRTDSGSSTGVSTATGASHNGRALTRPANGTSHSHRPATQGHARHMAPHHSPAKPHRPSQMNPHPRFLAPTLSPHPGPIPGSYHGELQQSSPFPNPLLPRPPATSPQLPPNPHLSAPILQVELQQNHPQLPPHQARANLLWQCPTLPANLLAVDLLHPLRGRARADPHPFTPHMQQQTPAASQLQMSLLPRPSMRQVKQCHQQMLLLRQARQAT